MLLNKIEEEAKDLGIPTEFMEIEERDGAFHRSIVFYVHKLIKRMSVKEKNVRLWKAGIVYSESFLNKV